MAHYEEKLSRATARQPTAAELRTQLVTLRSDLEHFQSSKASNGLVDSLKERIRQIEAQLAHIPGKPARAPAASEADTRPPVYATSAHYTARARRAP